MGQVRDFLMPDLGEGLESGEIVEWHVDVGDHVELNEEICDVETAKAVVSVPCPFAGTVEERFGEVGEEIEVGTPLIRIDVEEVASGADVPDEVAEQLEAVEEAGEAGEEAAAGGEAGPEAGPEDAASERKSDLDADEEPQPLVGYGQSGSATRRRRRRGKQATEPDVPGRPPGDGQVAAGGNGQRQGAPGDGRRQAAPGDGRHQAAPGDGRREVTKPLAKPPVRKLAKDLGVDLHEIAPGSGEGGIVTREDVRAAAEAPEREEARPAAPAREVAAAEGFGFRGREPGDTIPITGIRKRIVEKMVTSRTEIPEATTSVTVDCTPTWELAERLTEQAREQGYETRVSAFAIVARATILALRRFPTLNATLDEDAGEIRLLEPIHLGLAVDTDRGLMVPNIKDAHTKSTLELASEITRLARAARDGDATPGELTGGTFTVNNYGFLGNDTGNPIINHPEAGILGIGAMKERPWVVDGELAVRRTVTLTIAFDHRVSDGGEAGRFVAYAGELVEEPSRILLHA